jgi:hypothetical protein
MLKINNVGYLFSLFYYGFNVSPRKKEIHCTKGKKKHGKTNKVPELHDGAAQGG